MTKPKAAKRIVVIKTASGNSHMFCRWEGTGLERGLESCSQEAGKIQQNLGLLRNVISFFLRFLRSGNIKFNNMRKGWPTALHQPQQEGPFISPRTTGHGMAQIQP